MSRISRLFTVIVLTLFLTSCKTGADDSLYRKLWEGNLTAPNHKVKVIFSFKKSLFRNTECSITIPEQGVVDLQASQCRTTHDSLHLEFSGYLTANYDAKITRSEILGKWSQNGYLLNLDLKKTEKTMLHSYMETALIFARQNSLNSRLVDWPKLSEKVMKLSQNAKNVNQLIPAFQFILRNLKDKHGSVVFHNKRIAYETEDFKSASAAFKKAAYGNNKEIVSAQMSESIGYLRIPKSPDFELDEDEKFNQEIQKHVCDLIAKGTIHWIIDLRLNEGGSMFPMLAGLNRLFENRKIGSFVDSDRRETQQWLIKKGNFYVDQEQKTTSGYRCNYRLEIGKTAILTGPATASSGEAVVVALRGMENSKIFGELTRGFTTAVAGIHIGDDIFFTVSTGYYADANGRVYDHPIFPDIQVGQGDNFEEILKDKKVLAAMKWIQE